MNIHEPVNKLICIHELTLVRQCLSFGLVPHLYQSILTSGRGMINLPCLIIIIIFLQIHDYANEVICIFEYRMKGQFLSFNFGTKFCTLCGTQAVI